MTASEPPIVRGPASHLTASGKAKIAYEGRKLARKAARIQFDLFGTRLKPYRCATCPGWHLSSSIRRDGFA